MTVMQFSCEHMTDSSSSENCLLPFQLIQVTDATNSFTKQSSFTQTTCPNTQAIHYRAELPQQSLLYIYRGGKVWKGGQTFPLSAMSMNHRDGKRELTS